MHTDEGTLQAYLDGELTGPGRARVAGHVAACGECARALGRLRSASDGAAAALALLDRPAPTASAYARVSAGGGSGAGGGAGPRAGAEGRRPGRFAAAVPASAWLRAAVFVLAFAGVASAAFPGSPVRAWAGAAWERTAGLFGGGTGPTVTAAAEADAGAPEAAAAAAAETGASPGGVSVLPAGGSVRIVFDAQDAASRVRVRVVEGERAAVHAVSAGGAPRFRTSPGRIQVIGGGRADWIVELPASARAAVVEVDGRVLVVKEGSRLRVLAPDHEGEGSDVRFRLD